MDTACRKGENWKYAANSKLAKHAGMPQRLYLRFLRAKRAVCSWVPEFAVYFRRAVPGVWEKSRSADQTPVLRFRDLRFVAKNQVVLGGFRFFPALPELKPQTEGSSNSGGIRDNIQLSRKRQRAVAGKPNNDPPLSSPHVEPAARILPSRRWTINSSS